MAQAFRTVSPRIRTKAAAHHLSRNDLHLPRQFRGRQHMATALVIGLVAIVAFRAFPLRDVTVLTNGQTIEVSATFDPRVEGLAAAAVDVTDADRVLYATGGRHASVAVQRARAVTVLVDGESLVVRTQAATIAGALASAAVDLRPGDRLYLNSRLTTATAPLAPSGLASQDAGPATEPQIHVEIARSRPVTVYLDRLRIETSSSAPTVEAVLQDLGLIVREGDLVRPGLDSAFTAGMTVHLAKAKTLAVQLDGKNQSLYTQANTVRDVLAVLGLQIGPDDVVTPSLDTWLTDGDAITIGLTRTVEERTETPIAAGVRYETDASLAPGTTRVVAGVDGLRVTTYSVTYRAGVETARRQISVTTAREPVPTRYITSARTAPARPSVATGEYTGPYLRKVLVRTTWYNATHGEKSRDDPAYGITYTGKRLEYGMCAVDPSVIPLGTAMYIPKYGRCVAEDIGGMVRGYHVDLGFPESAINPWGDELIEIYILP